MDSPSLFKQLKQTGHNIRIVLLDYRHDWTVIPEGREINEVSPTSSPAYYMEGVSKTYSREEEPRWGPAVTLK